MTVYAGVVAVGSAIALAVYAVVGLPILATLVARASREAAGGVAHADAARAADGFATLAVQLGLLLLFAVTFVRTHPRVRVAWARGTLMGAIARRG